MVYLFIYKIIVIKTKGEIKMDKLNKRIREFAEENAYISWAITIISMQKSMLIER